MSRAPSRVVDCGSSLPLCRRRRAAARPRSLVECALHFLDRSLATAFFRDSRVLRAARRGNLANETEIAPLQLARCTLFGRQRAAAAASPPARCSCRRAARLLRSRTGRASRAAAHRLCGGHRSARCRSKGLQSLLEIADLAMHVAHVTIHVRRRHTAVIDHPLENVLRLAGRQLG